MKEQHLTVSIIDKKSSSGLLVSHSFREEHLGSKQRLSDSHQFSPADRSADHITAALVHEQMEICALGSIRFYDIHAN